LARGTRRFRRFHTRPGAHMRCRAARLARTVWEGTAFLIDSSRRGAARRVTRSAPRPPSLALLGGSFCLAGPSRSGVSPPRNGTGMTASLFGRRAASTRTALLGIGQASLSCLRARGFHSQALSVCLVPVVTASLPVWFAGRIGTSASHPV
jgi:hypothetical protein